MPVRPADADSVRSMAAALRTPECGTRWMGRLVRLSLAAPELLSFIKHWQRSKWQHLRPLHSGSNDGLAVAQGLAQILGAQSLQLGLAHPLIPPADLKVLRLPPSAIIPIPRRCAYPDGRTGGVQEASELGAIGRGGIVGTGGVEAVEELVACRPALLPLLPVRDSLRCCRLGLVFPVTSLLFLFRPRHVASPGQSALGLNSDRGGEGEPFARSRRSLGWVN